MDVHRKPDMNSLVQYMYCIVVLFHRFLLEDAHIDYNIYDGKELDNDNDSEEFEHS